MSSPLPSVDERIKIIAERLADLDSDFNKKRFPGLKSLLDDYINPNVDINDIKFHRGLLQVFKNSEDQTYEKLLAQHTSGERSRVEKFVAGGELKDVGKGFVMGPSLGCRDEIARMHKADSVFHLSATGPVHVHGLSTDELKHTDGHWFYEAIHKLAGLFHHDDQDHESVLVRSLQKKTRSYSLLTYD